MRDIKSAYELTLDKAVYPWQLVEGEGKTWLILRQQRKIQANEINKIQDVFLEEFSWSIIEKQSDRSLYKGNIRFNVHYKKKNKEDLDIQFEAAEREEFLCRNLSSDDKHAGPDMKARDTSYSSFLSKVYDEIKPFSGIQPAKSDENGIWKVNIPWQVWLYGEGEAEEPRVQKVHIGQIGLSTLLLEVLIKLENIPDYSFTKFREKNSRMLPKEETIYTIKEEVIREILGISVKRAFYACYLEPGTKGVFLSNLKKTTIIFIGAKDSNEKILTASHLNTEQVRLNDYPAPVLPPVGYKCFIGILDVAKIETNKVLCKNESVWTIDYDFTVEKYSQEITGINENIKIGPAQIIPIPVFRKKPGERWMKKPGEKNSSGGKTRMVLTIRK